MLADRYIYAKLTADAGVAALVGTRIYPVTIPQDAPYPAIVYSAVYTPASASKTGPATHDNAIVTIRSWAAKYDDAAAIDVAVRNALDYEDNSGAGVTAAGVTVDILQWQQSSDGVEEGNSAPGGAPYFFRQSEYFIRERN